MTILEKYNTISPSTKSTKIKKQKLIISYLELIYPEESAVLQQ